MQHHKGHLDFRCPASAEQLPFDETSFDFAYSIAAFEHFRDPEKAVYELYRTLKPGAVAYIHIDLKDHDPCFHKSAPLEFLKTPPEKWVRIINNSHCNCHFTRYRAPQYLNWFERAGFQLQTVENILYEGDIASERIEFAHDMQPFSNEELSIIAMNLVLRK